MKIDLNVRDNDFFVREMVKMRKNGCEIVNRHSYGGHVFLLNPETFGKGRSNMSVDEEIEKLKKKLI